MFIIIIFQLNSARYSSVLLSLSSVHLVFRTDEFPPLRQYMKLDTLFCISFVRLYTVDLYGYEYLCIVCFSLSCKAL